MAEVLSPAHRSCNENQGPMLLALGYVLLFTAISSVALRLYVKLGLRNGVRSDDYTIVASLVAGAVGMGCLTKFVLIGMGRHIYCLPPEQVPLVLKWSIISQICNNVGIGLAKISVCLCVLRIIGRTRKNLATFLWVVVAFCAASHLAQVMLFLVQCRPMAAVWNPRVRGKCFSPHITYLAGYIGFGLDAFTDLVCAAIPISIFHRLQMNGRTKAALCCLIGLGSLTAGCAVAKAVLLKGVFAQDFTWALWKPAVCTITEHLTSITLVSLPALRPFFNRLLDAATTPGSSGKRSVKHSPRWAPAPAASSASSSRDIYALEASLKGPERPHDNEIIRTTEFRLSEHTSENGDHRMGDYWPLPP